MHASILVMISNIDGTRRDEAWRISDCFTDFDTGTVGIADNAGSDPSTAAGMAVGGMPAAGSAHSGTYMVTRHASSSYHVGLSTRRSHNS